MTNKDYIKKLLLSDTSTFENLSYLLEDTENKVILDQMNNRFLSGIKSGVIWLVSTPDFKEQFIFINKQANIITWKYTNESK